MRIGIVSDTHMPTRGQSLPHAVVQGLRGVDLILHAGDFCNKEAVVQLERIAPVEGVAGNNDGPEIVKRFGRKKILTLNGFTLGLVHGDGTRLTTERRALEAFKGEAVEIFVFGHSHVPMMKTTGGILLFNPGSAMDRRRQPKFSFGLLDLSGPQPKPEHVFYDSKA